MGSLLPPPGKDPAFSQIYIYSSDPGEQVQFRISYHHDMLDLTIVHALQSMLRRSNPYIEMFLTASERLAQTSNVALCIKLVAGPHYDSRRYNRPTANEIAVIMVGTDEQPTIRRDIVLHGRRYGLQRIYETHSSYNPLRYPMFFPFGEQGWHINMYIPVSYVSPLIRTITDRHIIEDATHIKLLNVSIIPFFFIIDGTNSIFYIEAVYYFKNILSMHMHKLSNAV
jgi:hypothetical protein